MFRKGFSCMESSAYEGGYDSDYGSIYDQDFVFYDDEYEEDESSDDLSYDHISYDEEQDSEDNEN